MTAYVPEGFPKLDKATRPWVCKIDSAGCTRVAPCRSCLGRRSRRSGMTKQRQARKTIERQTGTQAGRYASQTGNEENWRLSIRAEVKSGKQVASTASLYRKAREQSDAAHATGDCRPFALVCMPSSWPSGALLYVVHSEDVEAFVDAFTPDPSGSQE